jgi:hypothetical protein
MKRSWALGVVAVLALAAGCSDNGGGKVDGGGTLPDGGPIPDGGCTGASCPGDGGTDGGATGALTATPDRIVVQTTPGAAKTAQLTLQNTSASTVSLQSLNVSGAGASAFSVSGANVPMNLAAGASATLTVSFNGTQGVSQAMLAAATPAGTTNVPLGGLAIPADTEPSLQWIFDVHNIPVHAGNPDPTKKDLPPVPIAGEEMGIQSFVKAGSGPVTLQLLASEGPDFEPVSINGWYVSGNAGSRVELFRIAQANHFALDPPIESGGTLSFDPGTNAFGFWNEWPFWETPNQGIGQYFIYQEDALNTWDSGQGGGKHHMRVYPYKNPDGSLDPHAFILTTEEAPFAVGPDFNDVVYVIRNVKPATSGGAGGALQLLNGDGAPSSNRMMFNVITTIAPCWGPLNVKDSGTVTVKNTSGGTVNVSSIDVTDAYTATPSMGLPAALAPGASFDVAVKFTATDGRIHNGTLNVHSDDSTAPTVTMNLAGFRQDVPQNTFFPQTSSEPDFDEVVNGLYGYTTVVGTKQQLIDVGEQRIAIGDEVLSAYWVKADASQPVSMRLTSAFHSGWDCGDPTAVSYGSFAYWFPRGRTSANDDRYILGGAKEDIQRMLPRGFENPANQAANTFDPGSTAFGFHIELEFSDESLIGPLDITPLCQPGQVCGHRMRFFPLKDASGSVLANTWIVTVDMHRPATAGRPQDFFSNYDYNDETYVVQNMKPAP